MIFYKTPRLGRFQLCNPEIEREQCNQQAHQEDAGESPDFVKHRIFTQPAQYKKCGRQRQHVTNVALREAAGDGYKQDT